MRWGRRTAARVRELGRRYERAIEALIRQGIAREVFYPGQPRLMTYTLLRATLGVASWYAPQGALQPAEIVEGVTRQVLAGCCGRATRRRLSCLQRWIPAAQRALIAILLL